MYGVFHPVRRHGAIPVMRDAGELAQFVRARVPFPFVAKPALGIWGKGVYAVQALTDSGELVMVNGERMSVDGFVDAIAPEGKRGYLFQELLRPHPRVAELCGSRICSVRIVTIL